MGIFRLLADTPGRSGCQILAAQPNSSARGAMMIWWQWFVLGALLLGAEIAIDAEFYLVFLGISAIVVGLIGLTPRLLNE